MKYSKKCTKHSWIYIGNDHQGNGALFLLLKSPDSDSNQFNLKVSNPKESHFVCLAFSKLNSFLKSTEISFNEELPTATKV